MPPKSLKRGRLSRTPRAATAPTRRSVVAKHGRTTCSALAAPSTPAAMPDSPTKTQTSEGLETFMTFAHVVFSWNPTFEYAMMTTGLTVGHVVSGEPRIQLIPSYLQSAVAAAGMFTDLEEYASQIQLMFGLMLLLGLFIRFAMPLVTLPEPRGHCAVASVVTTVRAADTEAGVSFNLHVFYPAGVPASKARKGKAKEVRPEGVQPAPYFRAGSTAAEGVARFVSLPPWLLAHMQYTRHSTWDAGTGGKMADVGAPLEPLALKKASVRKEDVRSPKDLVSLPVVLFSHGLGGNPELYRTLCQDMASEGYVVAAPEHNDGSAMYTRVPGDKEADMGRFCRKLTLQEKRDPKMQYAFRNGQLRRRVQEVRATYDVLARVAATKATWGGAPNDEAAKGGVDAAKAEVEALPLCEQHLSFLAQRVDMSRVGVAGHSFGGGTALEFSSTYPGRVKGCIALDAWTEPLSKTTLSKGLPTVPVLAITGDGFTKWEVNAKPLRAMLCPPTDGEFEAADESDDPSPIPNGGAETTGGERVVDTTGGADGDGAAASSAAGDTSGLRSRRVKKGLVRVSEAALKKAAQVEDVTLPSGYHPANVVMRLARTEHQNFCDTAWMSPLTMRRQGSIGQMNPTEAMLRISTYMSHFLFRHLRAKGLSPAEMAAKDQSAELVELMRLADPHPDAHPKEVRIWTFTGEHPPTE